MKTEGLQNNANSSQNKGSLHFSEEGSTDKSSRKNSNWRGSENFDRDSSKMPSEGSGKWADKEGGKWIDDLSSVAQEFDTKVQGWIQKRPIAIFVGAIAVGFLASVLTQKFTSSSKKSMIGKDSKEKRNAH